MGTNHGNHGAKGRSGRKSAYQEKADAERLFELWFKKMDIAKIKASLSKGKVSAEMFFLSRVLSGNERCLIELFKKVYPDKTILDHQGKVDVGRTVIQVVEPKPVTKPEDTEDERGE